MRSFVFPCRFLNYLLYFCKKCHWYFDRDYIESVDCLGYRGHFNNINPSNPRTWGILLFVSFSSFYMFYQNVFHFYFPSRRLKMFCLSLCVFVFSHVWLFLTPWTIALPLLSMELPGKNTRVGCHFLLQGIFPIKWSNLHLLCLCFGRQILY